MKFNRSKSSFHTDLGMIMNGNVNIGEKKIFVYFVIMISESV
jgi:hypothetical protein